MNAPRHALWYAQAEHAGELLPAVEMDRFNLEIELVSGDLYSLSVWTYAELARLHEAAQQAGITRTNQYYLPPDLLVVSGDSAVIAAVVADLIATNSLREAWRIPDEYTVNWDDAPAPDDAPTAAEAQLARFQAAERLFFHATERTRQ